MRPTFILLPLSFASAAWGVPVCSTSAESRTYIATTWYASWHSQYLAVENISWSKYTSVAYSFACVHFKFSVEASCYTDYKLICRITTPDSSVISLADSDVALLPKFVQAAHDNVGDP